MSANIASIPLKEKKKQGRPLKYNPQELEIKVDKYINQCITEKKAPNITGLALALDVRRETVWEFEKNINKGLSNVIKKARARIEDIACDRVLNSNSVGAIFYLKSVFGYQDRQEIEIKHKGTIKVSIIKYGN